MKTMEEINAQRAIDAIRLKEIREMCGYVENGSDGYVKIFQDDATRTWCIEVSGKCYYGDTFNKAIDNAWAEHQKESY